MKKLIYFLIIFNGLAFLAIIGFLVYDGYTANQEAKKMGAGSSFTGENYLQNIVGTKTSPYKFATSSEVYVGKIQKPTTTSVLALNNADDVNMYIHYYPAQPSSTLAWYHEVCVAKDCQVDGPWTWPATTTVTYATAFDLNMHSVLGQRASSSPYSYIPQVADIPTTSPHIINYRLTNLNAGFLRTVFYTSSTTDDSSLWVVAALK